MKLWILETQLRDKAMTPSTDLGLEWNDLYPLLDKYRMCEDVIEEPLVYHAQQSERLFDVLQTSDMRMNLLSPRVAEGIEEAGLTGVRLSPVRILIDNGSELVGYRALRITGRCGPLIPLQDVPRGKPSQGARVDPETHDGSDFAQAKDDVAGWPLLSKQAHKVLKALKATNLRLEPLEELEYYAKGY